MQKLFNGLALLTMLFVFSLGNHCEAMYRRHQSDVVDVEKAQEDHPIKPTLKSVGKQCLCDGIKMSAGVTATAASLFAMFVTFAGCGTPGGYTDTSDKLVCSNAAGLTILTCGGASVLYTTYQGINLLRHSWGLVKLIKDKQVEMLVHATNCGSNFYQNY